MSKSYINNIYEYLPSQVFLFVVDLIKIVRCPLHSDMIYNRIF